MTQFNTTLTTAAPRKTAEPLTVRLMKLIAAPKERFTLWFASFEDKGNPYFDEYDV